MKKLKSLEFVEVLSKNDLKMVFGGLNKEIGDGDVCSSGMGCTVDEECPGSCKCNNDPVHGGECR